MNREVFFYRLIDVTKFTGVSGASIWKWVRAGTFPKPVKLGENTTAWLAGDVQAWADDRIAASKKEQ